MNLCKNPLKTTFLEEIVNNIKKILIQIFIQKTQILRKKIIKSTKKIQIMVITQKIQIAQKKMIDF